MASILEGRPLDFWYVPKERLNRNILSLIFGTVKCQSWNLDLVKLINDAPAAQNSGDGNLGRSVPSRKEKISMNIVQCR